MAQPDQQRENRGSLQPKDLFLGRQAASSQPVPAQKSSIGIRVCRSQLCALGNGPPWPGQAET